MKAAVLLLLFICCRTFAVAQCSDADPGVAVYRENFGGSYNSGNFGPALTSAQTSYTFRNSGSIDVGEYGIRKAVQNVSNWVDGRDHTGNNGYMMMIRSSLVNPVFLQKSVHNGCGASFQSVCFAAASLNRPGSGREVSVRVVVTDSATGNRLSSYETPVLKSNDSLVWNTYAFSYTIPVAVKDVRISFSLVSTTPVPDDFAIDDIRVSNQGGGASLSTFFLNINNAVQYTYPFYVCLNARVDFSVRDLDPSRMRGQMFQWQRMKEDFSYEDIPGATKPYFSIDSAKRSDSRFYQMRMADSGNINSYGCYVISYPIGLHVDPQPVILTNAPICEGQELLLSVEEGSNVYWSGPAGFAQIGKRITIPSVSAAKSGRYVAKVVFTPGCSQTIDTSINVNIRQNPLHFAFPADTVLCKGVKLLLDAGNPGASFAWSTGDTTALVRIEDSGTYRLMAYKDGCNKQVSIHVSEQEKPQAFLRSDTALCIGDTLVLNGRQVNASSFRWSTGDTTQYILVTRTNRYTLQAKNFCGTSTAGVNVSFERCYEDLLLPTAFTPNHDGLNDVFKPVNDISVRQYKMKIYSRWGQVIFNSTSMRKGWDGTVNRIEQPAGVYVWIVEYTSKTGRQKTASGTVMLVR